MGSFVFSQAPRNAPPKYEKKTTEMYTASPLEFILAAHGGCLSYMTFFIGKELGIDVKGTEIEVTASLDPAKFAGTNRSVRAGYQAVNVNIKVHGDASPDELELLKREVETRCPVSDNIANPTPVNITVSAAQVREAVYA